MTLTLVEDTGRMVRPAQSSADIQDTVQQSIARTFGVNPQDLASATRREAPIAFARQVAMYLTHVGLGLTLTDVGTLFGRDRTTVAHACQLIEDRRDDARFDRCLDVLESAVRAEANVRALPVEPNDLAIAQRRPCR